MSGLGVMFSAEIGLDDSRILADRIGRADSENPPVAQHHDLLVRS